MIGHTFPRHLLRHAQFWAAGGFLVAQFGADVYVWMTLWIAFCSAIFTYVLLTVVPELWAGWQHRRKERAAMEQRLRAARIAEMERSLGMIP